MMLTASRHPKGALEPTHASNDKGHTENTNGIRLLFRAVQVPYKQRVEVHSIKSVPRQTSVVPAERPDCREEQKIPTAMIPW